MLNAVGIKIDARADRLQQGLVDAGKGSAPGYFDKDMMVVRRPRRLHDADDWLFNYFHSKSTTNQEHLNDPTWTR